LQKAGESKLGFNLKRFFNFFRLLMKSRRAALGMSLLVLSVIVALLSPIAYPLDPQRTIVGGQFAQPEWVMAFPEGYYLSKNMVVINNPGFTSPAALQEWSYAYNQSQLSNISFSWSSSGSDVKSGSLQISSASSSPATVNVTKTFHYPYNGPPQKFVGSFAVKADGASPSQPVQVKLFVNTADRHYTFWSTNITQDGQWLSPKYSLDSTAEDFRATLGLKGTTGLTASSVIFSSITDYTFGFQATFYGPSKINVDNVNLKLYGSAYGLLGTDDLGNDLLAQNTWGARISLTVGLLASFIGISLGLIVGLIAGYKTGLVDEVLMRTTDMVLVIPALPLLLVLIAVLGASIFNIILVIGFLGWMGFARIIRAQVLTLKERPFVEAAKAAGAGTRQILTRHVFPNIISLTYVNLALTVPAAILTESALAFLGLFDPNTISWGRILDNAEVAGSLSVWWWVIPPGLGIAIVSVSFVLIGYALDEIFNPKLRLRR
jgi:ABC-type dipeptide/oligopeptide/nickel transport system permease subunit